MDGGGGAPGYVGPAGLDCQASTSLAPKKIEILVRGWRLLGFLDMNWWVGVEL